MNPSRTLADRFRTQRTDRIRVDGNEILSVFEFELHPDELVEVVVEDGRTTTPQGFTLDSTTPLAVQSSPPMHEEAPTTTRAAVDTLTIDVIEAWLPEHDRGDDAVAVRLWNTWRIDGSDQAWTGNAGIVVEDLDVPEGARVRIRLWCSDGLGNATFDDLVLVATVGPQSSPVDT